MEHLTLLLNSNNYFCTYLLFSFCFEDTSEWNNYLIQFLNSENTFTDIFRPQGMSVSLFDLLGYLQFFCDSRDISPLLDWWITWSKEITTNIIWKCYWTNFWMEKTISFADGVVRPFMKQDLVWWKRGGFGLAIFGLVWGNYVVNFVMQVQPCMYLDFRQYTSHNHHSSIK